MVFTQHGHPDPEKEEEGNVLVRWWGAQDSIRWEPTALLQLGNEEYGAVPAAC